MSSLYCSLRVRTVAFEDNLKNSNHQLSGDNTCVISLGTYLQYLVWKSTWSLSKTSKELAPTEENLYSRRCIVSLMAYDEIVHGNYVTVGFLVTDVS